MIIIEEKALIFFKKLHIISFALTWIYTLSYPYIDKALNLKSDYKPNYETTYEIIWTSAIPIMNTAALIVAIQQDIELYKKSHKKKI